jgi:hypothetical protein
VELPDVNVLIYAFREDVEHHAICRAWLTRAIEGEAQFGISPLTLSAVVRITTNARSFPQPSTHEEVFRFCEILIAQPHCRLIEPGDNHWAIFRRVCVDANIIGPRVSDAWYAALAIEHGCEWITLDRDFKRFAGLKWARPSG